MSAPRRCRTAAAESSRPSACGPASRARRRRIAKIHVSDQGHFGFARIDAAEQGCGAWVTWCPTARSARRCGRACRARADLEVFCPAQRVDDRVRARRGRARDRDAGAGPRSMRGSVVAADGIDRRCAARSASAAEMRDYEQTAVITTVLAATFHDHVAYERFTPRAAGVAAARRRPLHAGVDLEPGARRKRRWPGRTSNSSPKCRPFRISAGAVPEGRAAACVSPVLDPRRAHQCRPLRHRRQCRARRCIRWRAWDSTWACAMWRASPNSLPSRRGELDTGRGRRVRCLARGRPGGVIAFTDGLVRMFANPCARCGGCAIWDCWPSICCRRRRPRCRA